MVSQSFAHLVVILFIVLGNVAFFLEPAPRSGTAGGAA